MQESVWGSNQTSGYQNYIYTPQQIFEDEPEIEENWQIKSYLEEEQQTDIEKYSTKKTNEKEKQVQEKFEKELHQFSTLRKVLMPLLFDDQDVCKSFKKIFSDEEETQFSKLYKSILMSNKIIGEDTAEATDNFGYHCKLFSN